MSIEYAPEIAEIIERCRKRGFSIGRPEYLFTDSRGRPLDQHRLAKRVWRTTLKKIGLSERGQYNTKDTFITLALSAGEDRGWIAHLCGTSEQMIYRHYRSWMPSVRRDDGKRVAAILKIGPEIGPKGTRWSPGVYKIEKLERAGEIERRLAVKRGKKE